MPKLNQKGVAQVFLLLILLGGLGAGLFILLKGGSQVFEPKADNLPIEFRDKQNNPLTTNESGIPQTSSPGIRLILTSPLASGKTKSYRFAESVAKLDKADFSPYSGKPIVVNYTFKDTSAGPKFIWADFKGIVEEKEEEGFVRKSAQVILVSTSPTPTPTPSVTSTPSPTQTSTPTPTTTPTSSPTASPQPTQSGTVTPTITPSPTLPKGKSPATGSAVKTKKVLPPVLEQKDNQDAIGLISDWQEWLTNLIGSWIEQFKQVINNIFP